MIELARENDVVEIMAIERAAFSPAWTEGAVLRELDSGDAFFAAAKEGGQILGFIVLRYMADEAELFQIAVREDARRRGVGEALLQAAVENACGRAIFLEVRASNRAAAALYEKNGFTVCGRRRGYYDAPAEDALVMKYERGKDART
ncbi:MAG: ribosomal protein S18-alanine N-acetyltransferase [Oscillospiraceae bacterium]|jgi:ribosomal-protein-alanine N-acetyltransferase|nr:ribosomal protein S18-alanine N-acetyltransferase [Oscillospiraceae bacterium]